MARGCLMDGKKRDFAWQDGPVRAEPPYSAAASRLRAATSRAPARMSPVASSA